MTATMLPHTNGVHTASGQLHSGLDRGSVERIVREIVLRSAGGPPPSQEPRHGVAAGSQEQHARHHEQDGQNHP